jgi:hypothetical protein
VEVKYVGSLMGERGCSGSGSGSGSTRQGARQFSLVNLKLRREADFALFE